MYNLVVDELKSLCLNQGSSVVLTGGRSASKLYTALSSDNAFLKNRFYLGDERCVPLFSLESNVNLIRKTLFSVQSAKGWFPINGAASDLDVESSRYESLLPNVLDLVLLSVGEDGHIASLFQDSPTFGSRRKVAVVRDAPRPNQCRITITDRVIKTARNVVVMASGSTKGEILAEALFQPEDYQSLPVRLTIGRTWVLDKLARDAFLNKLKNKTCKTRIIHE